jgi:ribosomal protein S18 acetylase RimI-like enzyme
MARTLPTIRPARAEDADFIARNILAAQRGPLMCSAFEIALDRPEAECLAFLRRLSVARSKSWFHVSRFFIAEVEGEPAAALCAFAAAWTRRAARAAIEEVAGETGLDASEIFRRQAAAANCWVQGGDGDWMLEYVASLPAYRGRGLVQVLIEHALASGRAAGFRRASISFLIGNTPAERCYAKAGFAFAEEKRDPAFEALTGAPGFRRFARAI